RACGTGGGENRHGPAGNPPAQPDRRRRLSLRLRRRAQVRETLPPRVARASRHNDELCRPARRAETPARKEYLSRHRLCQLYRGDQSVRRFLWCRRRAHHLTGRRHCEARRAGRAHRAQRRHRAGPGRRSRAGAMRRQPGWRLIDKVRVITGDTDNTPYGGGTWASRAAGIGGEAAWQAGKALRGNVLGVAGAMLQAKPDELDIRNGIVVDKANSTERLPLEELARVAHFRPDTLPPGFQAELMAPRHYVPRAWLCAFTNGIQASYLEVDTDTGFVKLLKHWCVEDCGTIINPQLVDEQI